MLYRGIVHIWLETGTEGGLLAFQDERHIHHDPVSGEAKWSYDGLHTLHEGDRLTIYSREAPGHVLWSGVLEKILDRMTGDRFELEDPATNALMRQAPTNLPPQWLEWFRQEYPAELETVESVVPDDFDEMGREEIQRMFEGEEPGDPKRE